MTFQTLKSEMFYKKSYDNVKMKHFNHRTNFLRHNFHKSYEKLVIDLKVKYGNKQTIHTKQNLSKNRK